MTDKKPMKWNKRLYGSIICTILEGLLSGSNFMLLYYTFQSLWNQTMDIKIIGRMTLLLAGIFVLRVIIYSFGYVQGQVGGALVSRQIRLFLGDKIKRIPLANFQSAQIGDYINVSTENVNSYEKVLTHKVGDLIKNITLSLMLVIFVSTKHVPSAIIFLLAQLCIIPAIWLSFRQVRKYGKQKNEICTENVSSIVEYIHGIQTFRAYGIGGIKNKAVTHAMKSFCDISFIYELKIIPIGMTYSILSWCSLPLVIYIAGMDFKNGSLDAVTYIMLCLFPLFLTKLLGTIFIDFTSYKNLMIAKKKIKGVITEPEENKSKIPFHPKSYDIEFHKVAFSYITVEPVCKDINLRMEDGKLTAIVGDSGSGKSTILNLIMKYYEPTSGEIRIGGYSTKEAGVEQVLSKISMVDQDVFLFDDTIRNNIRYARENATDAEIESACKEANCDEFIKNLPNGYESMAGENGNQLSGGERQRISIARAILKNSPILLLDEATANLDVENELAVKNAISNLLRKKKTVVMIAHTLSIVKNADKIIVIADGRVKEEGNHKELLDQNGKYAAMWIAEQELLNNV